MRGPTPVSDGNLHQGEGPHARLRWESPRHSFVVVSGFGYSLILVSYAQVSAGASSLMSSPQALRAKPVNTVLSFWPNDGGAGDIAQRVSCTGLSLIPQNPCYRHAGVLILSLSL